MDLIGNAVRAHFDAAKLSTPDCRFAIGYVPKGAYSNIKKTKGGNIAGKVPVYVDRLSADGKPVVILNAPSIAPVNADGTTVDYGKVDHYTLFALALNGASSVINPPQPRKEGKGVTTYTAEFNAAAVAVGLSKSTRLHLDSPASRISADRLKGDLEAAGLWSTVCASAVPERTTETKKAETFYLAFDKAGKKALLHDEEAFVFNISEKKAGTLKSIMGRALYAFPYVKPTPSLKPVEPLTDPDTADATE